MDKDVNKIGDSNRKNPSPRQGAQNKAKAAKDDKILPLPNHVRDMFIPQEPPTHNTGYSKDPRLKRILQMQKNKSTTGK